MRRGTAAYDGPRLTSTAYTEYIWSSALQPADQVVDSAIRGKDGIPPFDDLPVLDCYHGSPENLVPFPLESGQIQAALKVEFVITQQLIRQMQTFMDLCLIAGRLRRDTIDLRDAQRVELRKVVSKRTSLGSASASAGDGIPGVGNNLVGCS